MIHREMVGLDLGSHSAKVVRAMRIAGHLIIRRSDWVHLPWDLSERARLLAAFLSDKGYTDVPCVVGVQGRDVMLNAVEVPARGGAAIADVVAREQQRVERLTEEDNAVDHVVFRSAGHRYLLLVMARAAGVGRAASCLSNIDEEDIGDIVPGVMALYRAVYELGPKGIAGSTLCVDVGHVGSEVVAGRGGKVLFSRCFAAEIRSNRAASTLTSLPGEIATCMESFHGSFSSPAFAVKRIVLSGGGALVDGLPQAVEQATGVTTMRLRQWSRRRTMGEVERYGRAIGLVACGLRRGGAGISLLPHALREIRVLQWQKRYWLLSMLVLAGLVLVLAGAMLMQLRWDRDYLRLRQAELAGLHAMDRKLDMTVEMNERQARWITPFRVAVANADVVRMALQAVSAAKHPDDWVSLLADANAYFETAAADGLTPEGGLRGARSAAMKHVIIEGYTPVGDLSTVAEMIERLRMQPGVVAADLLGDERLRKDSDRDARWEKTGCSLFVIEMTIEVP